MIVRRVLIASLFLILSACQLRAAEDTQAIEQEIRQAGQKYVSAFNRGDAKAIAENWTATGEYVSGDGQRIQGRDQIEQRFAAFFSANPGAKVHVKSDNIQLVNADTAIDDGRSVIGEDPTKALGFNRYTAVLVREQGRWLIASVHDKPEVIPIRERLLKHLDLMVGTWGADQGDVQVRAQCRWIADNQFMERTFAVRRGGEIVHSGTQVIGWDPTVQSITSWLFDSKGGHSRGIWTPVESGWVVDTADIMVDGTRSTAENHFTRIDENTVSWKSVNRKLGDMPLADMEEIVLKRQ